MILAIKLDTLFDITVLSINTVGWKDPVQAAYDASLIFKPVLQLLNETVHQGPTDAKVVEKLVVTSPLLDNIKNVLHVKVGNKLKMPNIKLLSSDGDIFEVDVDIAKQSVVVKTMLEGLGLDEGEDEAVPLPNVNAGILKKVIQWCTYHKDDPLPSEDDENKEKRTDDICSWDTEFLKVDEGTLFELIMAADYLDIKGLLDVTCKTVANMIKGKTPEEIRKIFNIKNDFTPPGEKQLFAAATTMPQTPEDDEQRKIDLASAFQNEDQMRCAKFTLPTATTLLDLPMELQEHILLEVITSEVRDRKLLRGAWKGLADRIAERMRNVCPQWDSALTSEAFRNRLHGILDSFPHVEFCFNVLARHRFFGCVNVAALNDELFVLCQQWHQHAHIDVYAHDDLQTAKRTIELRGVTMPWKLVACSMTNALYVLHQVSSNTEICRVSIDEHEIQASPWIACPSKLISRMSVSADGSLILFQGPAPSTVKVFNVDGSLQHEIELVNHVSYLHDVLSKSNGNFLLVKKKTLAEVDREGKTVCEYDKASGQFIYCALDIHDRIVMINDGGAVRLLDSEFNSVNNVKFRLESYKGSTKHFYQVQYNRKRNEFIAFESAAFSGAGAGQCLTVFNFTERSIPDGAQNEQNEQNSDSDADSNSDADSSSDADTNSD